MQLADGGLRRARWEAVKKRLRVVVEADESGRMEELAEGYSGYVPVSLRQVCIVLDYLTARLSNYYLSCICLCQTRPDASDPI